MKRTVYWGVGLCLLLSLGLLGGGTALALAGLERYRADTFLAHWAQQRKEPDDAAWQVAVAAAESARAWYPVRNGDYEDRLGRTLVWRHFQQRLAMPDAQVTRDAATEAYRRALAAREVAAYTRARLAHAKLYMLQVDDEFAREYGRALEQGPWRPEVLRELAEVGLDAWPLLAPAQREQAILAFRRAVTLGGRQARDLMQAADAKGLREVFCQHATGTLRQENVDCPVTGQATDRERKRSS